MNAAGWYCRNCELFLGKKLGHFCPNCGQDTANHPPTLLEFLHEFVSHYIALEGKLARSLALLFFRPGELTRRYLAGRKSSYVLPLRLYITASLLFFVVVKLFGVGSLVNEERQSADGKGGTPSLYQSESGGLTIRHTGSTGVTIPAIPESEKSRPFVDLLECGNVPTQCNKLKTYLTEKYGTRSALDVGRQVKDKLISMVPYAMFLMMPLFAFMTRLLYWKRKFLYGEHVVYALHVHAFAFFLLLAISLVDATVGTWLWFAGMLYFWLAMRRVFGGRWWATGLRYAFIGISYPLLLSMAIFAALAAAVFF